MIRPCIVYTLVKVYARANRPDLVAAMPRTSVLALALWSRTDAEAVCLAVLPASAVSAAVVEIKPASGCHGDSAVSSSSSSDAVVAS